MCFVSQQKNSTLKEGVLMPVIQFRHRRFVGESARQMLDDVRTIVVDSVVKRLSCDEEGGQLSIDDIALFDSESSPYDRMPYDIDIMVLAKHFDSRAANVQERSQQIWNDLEARRPGWEVSFCVYVLLCPAGFVDGPEVALKR